MKKRLMVTENLGGAVTELDDGKLEGVVGGASTNFYDCTNRQSCEGSNNWISCNSSTCLTDAT